MHEVRRSLDAVLGSRYRDVSRAHGPSALRDGRLRRILSSSRSGCDAGKARKPVYNISTGVVRVLLLLGSDDRDICFNSYSTYVERHVIVVHGANRKDTGRG